MSKSVLVIDYESGELAQYAAALASAGYRTLTASSSEKGLDIYDEHTPDVVFVNLLMPGTSGVDLLKKIRAHPSGEHTHVYLMSPLATGGNLAARSNGAAGTLSKPIPPGNLAAIAERHLGPGDALPDVETDVDAARRSRREAMERRGRESREEARRDPGGGSDLPMDRPLHAVVGAEGRIEQVGMPELFASLGREKFSGRLNLETTSGPEAVRFSDGFVVAVKTSDLISYLSRIGKITRAEAQNLRARRDNDGQEVPAALKALLQFTDREVEQVVEAWRVDHLRSLAELRRGEFVKIPGAGTGPLRVHPVVPVYHGVLWHYDAGAIAERLSAVADVTAPFYVSVPPSTLADARVEVVEVVARNCAQGLTLPNLLLLEAEDTKIMAAVYALMLLGIVTQDRKQAFDQEISRFDPVVRHARRTTDVPPGPVAEKAAPPPKPPVAPPSAGSNGTTRPAPPSPPPSTSARVEAPGNGGASRPSSSSSASSTNGAKRVRVATEKEAREDDTVVIKESPPSSYFTPPGAKAAAEAPPQAAAAPRMVHWDPQPVSADDLLEKGDQFMKEQTYSKAYECYDAAVLLDPYNVEALVKLARAAYRNKFLDSFDRHFESVRCCKKAIAIKPDFVPAYTTLVKICEEEGKENLIGGFVAAALDYDPDNKEMQKRLRSLSRRRDR
ncbi:MAG: response regulator [Deltaproteobacteria bacterium]|nr:response regulator [Deltaproteobacteria bacterium]